MPEGIALLLATLGCVAVLAGMLVYLIVSDYRAERLRAQDAKDIAERDRLNEVRDWFNH